MKNLLKLLIIVLIINLVPESFAQTFGVKAGFNGSKTNSGGLNFSGIYICQTEKEKRSVSYASKF